MFATKTQFQLRLLSTVFTGGDNDGHRMILCENVSCAKQ